MDLEISLSFFLQTLGEVRITCCVHSVLRPISVFLTMSTPLFPSFLIFRIHLELCLSIRQSFSRLEEVKEGAATKSNESFWKMPYQVMVQFAQCIETFLYGLHECLEISHLNVHASKEEGKLECQFVFCQRTGSL